MKLHDIVHAPVEKAKEVFDTSFLAALVTSPVLTFEKCEESDDFAMFIGGGPI